VRLMRILTHHSQLSDLQKGIKYIFMSMVAMLKTSYRY